MKSSGRWAWFPASVAIAGLMMAACGGAEPTATRVPPSPAPIATAVAATPTAVPTATSAPTPTAAAKRGGVLTIRMLFRAPVRDTYDTRGGASATFLTQALTNGLVFTNPYNFQTSAEVIGDLAESWQVSGDGTVFTFKLRRGVQWHDGKPFTSKDVAYSYGRAINPPEPTVAMVKSKFQVVSAVETPDDGTVVVSVKRPSAFFLEALAVAYSQIMPAHIPDMSIWNKQVIGTGPFTLRTDTDASVELNRNPTYFKPGLPYLDGLRYFVIADAALANASFRSGQVRAGTPFDADWGFAQHVETRRAIPGVQEQFFTADRHELWLRNGGALADRRVRQAMHLGIDRQEFNRLWLPDLPDKQVPLASWMIPASRGGRWALPPEELATLPGYNPATKAADQARAKELLKEAGYADGLKLRFRGGSYAPYAKAAEIATTLLKPIGVQATLEILARGADTQAKLTGDFDIYDGVGTGVADDPQENLINYVATGAGENYGKWSFPQIDRLLDEQDRSLDVAKRRQVLLEAQRALLQELPTIPLGYFGSPIFYWPEVRNIPRCYFAISPCYRWDGVWLDK